MNTFPHTKLYQPILNTPSINNLHQSLTVFSNKKIKSNNKQLELSYCGVHLGHKSLKLKSAWHSSISQFLIGSRNNSAILNTNDTLKYLIKALYIVTLIIKSGGHILIINTNPEYSKLLQQLKNNTQSSKISYSDCHWVGGILTNWSQIHKSINTFTNFYHKFDGFLLKNNIHFPRYKKMKKSFKGFINLSCKQNKQLNNNYKQNLVFKNNLFLKTKWKPDLIFILDSKNTGGIIKEASKLQIPIVALIDSSTNVANITYPIPTNNNSFNFVWLCLEYITKITNKFVLSLTS